MEKAEILASNQKDLEEAIHYLPGNFDISMLCKALKAVYSDLGKEKAEIWLMEAKNSLPPNFDTLWDEACLTSYQEAKFQEFVNNKVFDVAKEAGWIPKSLRKGKNHKKPPKKRALKQMAKVIDAEKNIKTNLALVKQRNKPQENKKYAPRQVLNIYGGCFIQPAMKISHILDKEEEHKNQLKKIVDCEVRVLEAIEIVSPSQQREEEDVEVRYLIQFNDKNGKFVKSTATHEDITTKTRFSNFLVKKGFIKFMGKNEDFDKFHEFLINEQEYPTVREAYSWGEWKDGIYLFENGIYDVAKKQFFKAEEKQRIKYDGNYVICPSGREQLRAPKLSVLQEDSEQFLADKFLLWQSFNGDLNVKVTIGYAVACVFSSELIKKSKGFPILFKFGERGTGKSSSMDSFMALFGYSQGNRQSIPKQNTLVAVKRMMTLPRSFPYFLDDYRSHQTNSQAPDLTSVILNWYHRIGTSMGEYSNDRRTVETPMKACVVMTGNDKPVDEAVLSRIIILNYSKFLQKGEIDKISEITDYTNRFSEFLALILQNYDSVHKTFFDALSKNKQYLSAQDFQGRTVDNWGIVLAGIECIPFIIPGLYSWKEEFEALRTEICEHIRKEEQLQKQHNPLHEFFQTIEYLATQKSDPESSFGRPYNMLDNRHFKIRELKTTENGSGQIICHRTTLALHLRGIWNVLEDKKAKITNTTSLAEIEGKLQNSSYFLEKSVQVVLAKSIVDTNKTSNRRCYLLNLEELHNKGMLEELIQKTCEYEKPDVRYSSY